MYGTTYRHTALSMVCPCVQLQIIQSRLSHCSKKKFVGFFLQYTHSMTRVFSVAMFNFCAGIYQTKYRSHGHSIGTSHGIYIHGHSIVVVFLATILHFRCCVPSNFATISRSTAVSILYDPLLCPYCTNQCCVLIVCSPCCVHTIIKYT